MRQLDERFVLARHRFLELVEHAFLLGQRGRELNRVLDPHAAVAAVAVRKREQRLGRRVVEVDRLVVVHVELDQAERILGPGLLDVLAVFHDEIIVLQPRLALGRQLLLANALGYRPCGIGDEPEDRRLQLRRRLVALAVDDLAVVDVLTVAPIIEEGGGGIDVDPRPRRIALQPAQTLHRHGELARAEPGPGAQRADRFLPEHAVGLGARIRLKLLDRRDQRRGVAPPARLRPAGCSAGSRRAKHRTTPESAGRARRA